MASETYVPLQQQQSHQQQQQLGLTAPQPPVPPEIEGFLKKLKRKTSASLLGGSWNKRWFFVDPRRREFGYAASKAPSAPRSSIFLDDITAVVQFDDTHFQVESRTRNFFLCGESKASASCWVSTLDEHRRKVAAYEKDKAAFLAACRSRDATLGADAASVVDPTTRGQSGQARTDKAARKLKKSPNDAEPTRESSSSDSSAGRAPDVRPQTDKPREGRGRASRTTREARRSPSPTSTPEPSPPRTASSRRDRPPRVPASRSSRDARRLARRALDRSGSDEDEDERGGGGGGGAPAAFASRGRIMEAWIDEDFD